jgi:hypothetical protein
MVVEFGAVAFSAGVEVTVCNFGVALSIALLGPAPALVIAIVPLALESIHRRIPPAGVAGNVAVYAVLAVAGSLGLGAWLGHPPDVSPRTLLFVVAGLALVAEYVTHFYVGLLEAVILHQSMRRTFRQTLWPLVPFHDDALQQLAVARLELPGGSVDSAQRSLDAADSALRGTLARVVPAAEALGSGGLAVALERVAPDLCERAGLAWTVRVDPALDGEDPPLVVSIARELVTNAVKHAEREHFGLALVENRARATGGGLEILPAAGGGSVVAVELARP